MTKKLILILLSLWLGFTALIDFAVVPTVFKVVDDFFNAGELGIALFSKLNLLEIIFSSSLLALLALEIKKAPFIKWKLTLGLCAWIIVMVYLTYLTPKITELTGLWKAADLAQTTGSGNIQDIQQEHQSFHRLYIILDSVKLILLSGLLGLELLSKETSLEKA
jgi:hypothetical protein